MRLSNLIIQPHFANSQLNLLKINIIDIMVWQSLLWVSVPAWVRAK